MMKEENTTNNPLWMPSDYRRFTRPSPQWYLKRAKTICITLFVVTLVFNMTSLFFLPVTMGVPIRGLEHLNRMSSILFLGAFTVMQGLLCYKGFTAIRCSVFGVFLLVFEAALVILNILYPSGLVFQG